MTIPENEHFEPQLREAALSGFDASAALDYAQILLTDYAGFLFPEGLIEVALAIEPQNERALALLAHVARYERLDQNSVNDAILRIDAFDGPITTGVLPLMKAQLLVWQDGETDELVQEELNRKSAELSPDWVWNHHDLGSTLYRGGRIREAIDEYEIALRNIVDYDTIDSEVEASYRALFIQGGLSAKRLQARIRGLQEEL